MDVSFLSSIFRPLFTWCRRPGSNRYGRLVPQDFKSCASANFATPAEYIYFTSAGRVLSIASALAVPVGPSALREQRPVEKFAAAARVAVGTGPWAGPLKAAARIHPSISLHDHFGGKIHRNAAISNGIITPRNHQFDAGTHVEIPAAGYAYHGVNGQFDLAFDAAGSAATRGAVSNFHRYTDPALDAEFSTSDAADMKSMYGCFLYAARTLDDFYLAAGVRHSLKPHGNLAIAFLKEHRVQHLTGPIWFGAAGPGRGAPGGGFGTAIGLDTADARIAATRILTIIEEHDGSSFSVRNGSGAYGIICGEIGNGSIEVLIPGYALVAPIGLTGYNSKVICVRKLT